MNELQVFKNEELGKIRGIELDGKPYLVANDVLKALGYVEGSWRTILSRKCKGVTKCNGLKVNGIEINLIPEGDVYRLIFSSKLPKAQEFEEWVMDKVLPQIRQTGGYIPFSQEESDEEILARALIVAKNTLDKKNELIEQMKPKVEYHDKVLNVDKLVTTTDIAKDLGMTARQLHNKLHDMKIIFKTGNHWTFYAKYQTRIPLYADYQIGEHGQILKWTEKGRKWIIKLLNEQKEKDEKKENKD